MTRGAVATMADLRATARDNAAALRNATRPEPATIPTGTDKPARPDTDPLPDIEYNDPITDAEQVPVATALARVMADVQSIAKKDRRDDPGGKYDFRGVDRVINAVGPALRRHGVLILPARVFDVTYGETRTKSGTVMQECTLKVEWVVIGPSGDRLPVDLQSAGQATDTADKATAKAISVAQRVVFLSALHIPTEDATVDKGPDRGERPQASPNAYRDEIVHPDTSLGRLKTIRGELLRLGLGAHEAVNEVGDSEALVPMIDRIGSERRAAGGDPS